MGLTTISLLHIVAALEWRDPYRSVFNRDTIANGRFNLLMLAALVLTFLATTIGGLQRILDTVELDGDQWRVCLIAVDRLLRPRRARQVRPPPLRRGRHGVSDLDRPEQPRTRRTGSPTSCGSHPGTQANLAGRDTALERGRRVRRAVRRRARRRRQGRPRPRASSSSRTPRSCCGRATPTPCSSSSRRWTPPARTRRSSTSCPASTRRACTSSRSSNRRARSSTTRSCGGSPRPCPSGAGSGSSTARTTRRSSPSGCTPSGSTSQQLPAGDRGPDFWAGRYDDLNAFEQHLDRNGMKVVKFFLHVSKAEQKRRFMARLDNPDKLWKFSAGDVAVAPALGRVHAGLRGRHHRHLDRVGAVVRDPGRPQARHAGDGRRRSSSTRSRASTCSGRPCRPRTGQPTQQARQELEAESE